MAYLNEMGLAHLMDKLKPNLIHYGTCATAAATAAKVASDVEGVDKLFTGLTIAVKFTYANAKANPTLNVNSLGAKPIMRYGTTVPSTSAASSWNAGSVVTFTYDGTNWQMHDWNNTTYSSMTVAEYEAGTGTTARTITPARLKAAILEWAPSYTGQDPIGINGTAIGLYAYFAGTKYRVTRLEHTTVDGISGMAIAYDDGSTDGGQVFLPDGVAMAGVSTYLQGLISDASDLAGDAMSAATGAYVLNVTYAISNGTVTCSAHVYSAGSEVTSDFADSCFTWSYNTGNGWVATSTHAKTYTPSVLSAFGGSVKCDFTPPSN